MTYQTGTFFLTLISFLDEKYEILLAFITQKLKSRHLSLMTSFKTHAETIEVIKKYVNQSSVRILTFSQSRYPRMFQDTMLPCPRTAEDESRT